MRRTRSSGKSSQPTRARRSAGYYRVAGLDLRSEMARLCRLRVFGGAAGPLTGRPPTLTIRRASKRPRSRLGFAIPEEWRISVTAYPGQRQSDVLETLLHELVHLYVGAAPGTRRWHGREFRATMRQAMREAYGLRGVEVNGSYHGAYADALEHRSSRQARRRSLHPGQLALIEFVPEQP